MVDEQSYKFSGGKEVTIYDPTQYKKHVEVHYKWGDGKIALSWPYSGGYRKPTWMHTARSSALKTSNSTMRDEAKTIYNNTKVYGVWKHGVGNGIGY